MCVWFSCVLSGISRDLQRCFALCLRIPVSFSCESIIGFWVVESLVYGISSLLTLELWSCWNSRLIILNSIALRALRVQICLIEIVFSLIVQIVMSLT